MAETSTVTLEISMTTALNSTVAKAPEAPYMRVILAYYITCAVVMGFLLLCALRVAFMLIFYDFFYPSEEEVRDLEEEQEARRRKAEKEGKVMESNPVSLALSGEHLQDQPPRMFLLHQAYEKQRAESLLDIKTIW